MEKIKNIHAREILDSRGNPTVECDVELDDGSFGRAAVPSGASTGVHEALELRDGDTNRYLGKGVKKAVQNINNMIKNEVVGKIYSNYQAFDKTVLGLDGTENKSNIGANATLAASLAFAKSLADHTSTTLYQHIAEDHNFLLPVPMMNIINGGSHADNDVDIQEFMIAPVGASSFSESLRFGCEIFHSLKSILKSKSLNTNVGDEGGFAPSINTNEEALELIVKAIEKSKIIPGKDVVICLDVAANELINKEGQYSIQSNNFSSVDDVISYYKKLTSKYPIKSIEDPFAENDWDSWKKITAEIGKDVQIVGDDLFVTNSKRLKKGINSNSANSILVKPNQIGTLSETLEVVEMAKKANFKTIISHRSGDTEDTFIADLAVATESSQIKTGSLARSERVAKYNRLLRIEEELGNQVKMARI